MSLRVGTCSFSVKSNGQVQIDEIKVIVQILGEEKILTFELGQKVKTSDMCFQSGIPPFTEGVISKLRVPESQDHRFVQVVFSGYPLPRNFYFWEISVAKSEKPEANSARPFGASDDGSAPDLEDPVFNRL